jgi:hypothetical protein
MEGRDESLRFVRELHSSVSRHCGAVHLGHSVFEQESERLRVGHYVEHVRGSADLRFVGVGE